MPTHPIVWFIFIAMVFVSVSSTDVTCPVDVVFVLDRSRGVTLQELDHQKKAVENYLMSPSFDERSMRSALVTYAGRPTTEYSFYQNEATDKTAACDVVHKLPSRRKGDTRIGAAVLEAATLLVNRPARGFATSPVVVLFTDGGNDETLRSLEDIMKTYFKVTQGRICIIETRDPKQNFRQKLNRDNVLYTIHDASKGNTCTLWGFEMETELSKKKEKKLLNFVKKCICGDC